VTETGWSDGLLEAGFGDPTVAAAVGWPARVARMVEVEAALARAQADVGLIEPDAADAVAAACDVSRLDLAALAGETSRAASPVIPLVRALTNLADAPAAAWLHHGATSQDIVDTAGVLQTRDALDVLDRHLAAAADRCAALADEHRASVLPGRTLGQQAVPITFGLVAARWYGALRRRREQLAWVRPRVLVVQLGGAAGTGAVWEDRGPALVDALAERLGLVAPPLPWHAERDRVAELAGALAAVAGMVESIANQLVLHAQSEVAELHETPGGGSGSTAMPHKRNPTEATAARAAARLARGEATTLLDASAGHEFERAAGPWQAEWVSLPSLLTRVAGAAGRLADALVRVEVDTGRMQANLLASGGLTASEALATALAPAMGRPAARALTAELAARAVTEDRPLSAVAATDDRVLAHLDREAVATALDPDRVVALASVLIDRALAGGDVPGGGGAPV
jgi:3-carboxy-cis,cis-muconate cycloisomerase